MRTASARIMPGSVEFVILMASLTALEAFAIDAMIPALKEIGQSLGATGNQPQLVVGAIFLGLAFGQFASGALSDSLGRKPVILMFLVIFLVGTAISIAATEFSHMLIGRVLQGFGSAGPQIVSLAIIRDCFTGREMARKVSFVMSVFIIVPIIAPLVGQGVLIFTEWRGIFILLAAMALFLMVWFGMRQPETLPHGQRTQLSLSGYVKTARSVIGERALIVFAGVYGLILGAFVGYLSSSQQIFQSLYGMGKLFPVLFGILSISIGLAMVLNGMLVMRLGMRRLTMLAVLGMIVLTVPFWILSQAFVGQPPFLWMMVWLCATMFCVGVAFGNAGALALEPFGENSGMAATLFGGTSILIALLIGTLIGQTYNDSILPLATGFIVAPALAMTLMALGGGLPDRQERV